MSRERSGKKLPVWHVSQSSDSDRLYEQTPFYSPSPLHGEFPLSIYFFLPIESRSCTCNQSPCCKYRPQAEGVRFPDAANRRQLPKESLLPVKSKEVTRPQLRFPSFAGGDSTPRWSRGAAWPHAVLRDGRGGWPHRHLHRRHSSRRPRRHRREAQTWRSDYPGQWCSTFCDPFHVGFRYSTLSAFRGKC